jgi:hypothetical protein
MLEIITQIEEKDKITLTQIGLYLNRSLRTRQAADVVSALPTITKS